MMLIFNLVVFILEVAASIAVVIVVGGAIVSAVSIALSAMFRS